MQSVVYIVFFSSTLTTNSFRSPLVHPPSHGCRSTHNSPIHTATGSRLTQNFSVSVPTLIYTGTRLLRLQSWGEAGHGQSGCRGRQAGSIGRYHKSLLLTFLTSNSASIKDFCLADIKALTMEAKVFFQLPKSLPQILSEPYDFWYCILRTLQLYLCEYFCVCLELKLIMLLMKQTLTLWFACFLHVQSL